MVLSERNHINVSSTRTHRKTMCTITAGHVSIMLQFSIKWVLMSPNEFLSFGLFGDVDHNRRNCRTFRWRCTHSWERWKEPQYWQRVTAVLVSRCYMPSPTRATTMKARPAERGKKQSSWKRCYSLDVAGGKKHNIPFLGAPGPGGRLAEIG